MTLAFKPSGRNSWKTHSELKSEKSVMLGHSICLPQKAKLNVFEIWCLSGVLSIWYLFGTYPVPIWYLSSTYLVTIWYLSGTYPVLIRYLSCTFPVPIWYLSDTYPVLIWHHFPTFRPLWNHMSMISINALLCADSVICDCKIAHIVRTF